MTVEVGVGDVTTVSDLVETSARSWPHFVMMVATPAASPMRRTVIGEDELTTKQSGPESDRTICTFFRTEARMTASAEEVGPIEVAPAEAGIVGVINPIAAATCKVRVAKLGRQDGSVFRMPPLSS